MRKLILIGLLSVVLPSFAQAVVPAPMDDKAAVVSKPLKIGVVDVRAVVQKSAQLQQINLQLMNKFKPREQAIVRTQATYKAAQDLFNKEAANFTEAQRNKSERELAAARANLQAMITAFQQDLNNEQNSEMQKLLSEVASIVNDMAQSEHYDLILQGDSVPYVTDKLNMTDMVLQKLSKK